MSTRFLIVTIPRGGTHLLRGALAAHPNVVCYKEVHNAMCQDGKPWQHWRLDRLYGTLLRWDNHCVEPANRVLALGAPVHCEEQTIARGLWDLLGCGDYSYILLWRRDLLAQYVSLQIAIACGYWQQYMGKAPAWHPSMRVRVDRARYEGYLESCRWIRGEAERLTAGHRRLAVWYEQLCSEGFGSVSEFLGLPDPAMAPRTHRSELRSLPEVVENYDEVARLTD